ncbi:hypothetical protein SLS61_004937 [Didymella pomorum]
MDLMPESAMFRTFAKDAEDERGEKQTYRRHAYWLTSANYASDGEPRDGDTRQYDLVMRMRELPKEYNHALIWQSIILHDMKAPDSLDLRGSQYLLASDNKVITDKDGKTVGYSVIGLDCKTWGRHGEKKSHSVELAAIRARKDVDLFTDLVGRNVVRWIVASGARRW